MRELARKLGQLTARERVLLLEAWVALVVADIAIRILSLPRVLGLARVTRPPHGAADQPVVSRVVWLVAVAARYTPTASTCLTRSLVLSWLLGRQGVATAFRIGVARLGERLVAHAWLERAGEILGPAPTDQRYLTILDTDRVSSR